jgi:hypothetical protein
VGVQAGTWAIQSIFWLILFGSFALMALTLLLPGRRRTIAAEGPTAEAQAVEV